ncbi:NAD-dependent isocitrate dehydrogenase [Paragonimus heterotremus]|uniref:NAD-dependent isocitrate dehydrogenase n=1 Tax=Paragonimus heterotremus TaxID=100268 RepID=A0A8J4T2S9_9TREM|nr:NAD-dependent isocitrate dehydrogenase [Paragonimus heterotremus]
MKAFVCTLRTSWRGIWNWSGVNLTSTIGRNCRLSSTTSIVTDANIDAPAASKHFLHVGFHHDLPKACYGGRHTVAMLAGDGIGPEMMGYVKEVYQALGAPVDFEEIFVNHSCDETTFQDALLAMRRNGIGIKGNFATEPGQSSRNLALRTQLNLYAFVQRCRNFPGIKTRHDNVDIVIIRENTEGEYSRLEHENIPGVVESLKIITAEKSRRIAHFAFDYAVRYNRKKVTAVHKANIMKLADGLFLDTCCSVAKQYPQMGTRNSGRSLAGKNLANPCAMLLTSAELLEYLDHSDEANRLRDAIVQVIGVQKIRTRHLGGDSKTHAVVKAVLDCIRQPLA